MPTSFIYIAVLINSFLFVPLLHTTFFEIAFSLRDPRTYTELQEAKPKDCSLNNAQLNSACQKTMRQKGKWYNSDRDEIIWSFANVFFKLHNKTQTEYKISYWRAVNKKTIPSVFFTVFYKYFFIKSGLKNSPLNKQLLSNLVERINDWT